MMKRLTDDEIDVAYSKAVANFKRHKSSIRGQQVTPADGMDWHFANAIQDVLAEKNKGEVVHWRIVLTHETAGDYLPVPRVMGFTDKTMAENKIAEMKYFKGWDYKLEELYNTPQPDRVAELEAEVERLRGNLSAIASGAVIPPMTSEQAAQMYRWQDVAKAALAASKGE